jgi:uncharacterized protein YcbK (DUF882 family)
MTALWKWVKVLITGLLHGPKDKNASSDLNLFAASTSPALPKSSSPPIPASTKKPSSAEEDFQRELDKRGVEHFSAKECLFLGANNAVHKNNHAPTKALWKNFWPIIDIADTARDRIGKPLRITSGYRSPAYNKSVGGVSNSQHVQFKALDLAAPRPVLRKLYAELMAMRQEGQKIAIGRYATFIHIDVRGTNASWGSATY